MTDENIKNKCDECGGSINTNAVKGKNNTYLCGGNWMKGPGKCGNNVCFKCGKVETGTEWVQGYDCQDNPKMVEQKKEMFSQKEKDEKDPDRKLRVNYCDEHKTEALENPLKWTKENDKRIEKKAEQKNQEIEKKLNSQKELFYLIDPYARAAEWEQIQKKIAGIEYGCVRFQGQENGRNFWLLVPDTHQDIVNFKYKEKEKRDGREVEDTRWTLKKQFYQIEGVDNLTLEATSPVSHNSKTIFRICELKWLGLTIELRLFRLTVKESRKKNSRLEINRTINPPNP